MPALVRRRDDAVLCRERRGHTPQGRQLYVVNAMAPGIPLCERGLVQSIRKLQLVEVFTGQTAHLPERRFDFAQHLRWQGARQIRTQDAIILILIAERRRDLMERHDLPSIKVV
jgi:hypothetical protein